MSGWLHKWVVIGKCRLVVRLMDSRLSLFGVGSEGFGVRIV